MVLVVEERKFEKINKPLFEGEFRGKNSFRDHENHSKSRIIGKKET